VLLAVRDELVPAAHLAPDDVVAEEVAAP